MEHALLKCNVYKMANSTFLQMNPDHYTEEEEEMAPTFNCQF